ncbi:hypothetical protein DBV15_05793 [Temnothorax longispinosus]|uniref:Uncharacterized protein n=1 Tax=Temnothorax longispinosus TaxID=300112 RepID=A0A4V3SCM1_9HYME|nr:hypothetical protein DBV15_05793 [Temnothorax longispinosus]
MAGSRPTSFLPDSSSAFDKHRRREESPAHSSLLLLDYPSSGYLVTLVPRRAPLPADASSSAFGEVRAQHRGSEETFGGISTACYVAPVRGESDVLTVPGCAGLTSAAMDRVTYGLGQDTEETGAGESHLANVGIDCRDKADMILIYEEAET